MKEIMLVDINGNIAMENKMEKLVDIIIPAYKAHTTIKRTLASIAMQTFVDKVQVTVVNDCDGIGYSTFTEYFSKLIDIQELTLKVNSGPGVARQIGIDKTHLPYIVFMDADDTFSSAYAIETMLQAKQQNPKTSVIMFPFVQALEEDRIKFQRYEENTVWVFSKLYDRAFLDKYNIRFNMSRINEDMYFNRLIKLCTMEESEEPLFCDSPIYTWHYNKNSITRSEENFKYQKSLNSYAENALSSIQSAASRKYVKKFKINSEIIEEMTILYIHYSLICEHNPNGKEENFKLCLKFYDKLYSYIELIYGDSLKKYIIDNLKKRQSMLENIIPELTYNQFIDKLKEELEKQEVVDD